MISRTRKREALGNILIRERSHYLGAKQWHADAKIEELEQEAAKDFPSIPKDADRVKGKAKAKEKEKGKAEPEMFRRSDSDRRRQYPAWPG